MVELWSGGDERSWFGVDRNRHGWQIGLLVKRPGQVVPGRDHGIEMIFLVRPSSVSMYTDALHRPWFAAICLGVVMTTFWVV